MGFFTVLGPMASTEEIAHEIAAIFAEGPQTHLSLFRALGDRSPAAVTKILRNLVGERKVEPIGWVQTEVGEMAEFRWIGESKTPESSTSGAMESPGNTSSV